MLALRIWGYGMPCRTNVESYSVYTLSLSLPIVLNNSIPNGLLIFAAIWYYLILQRSMLPALGLTGYQEAYTLV